MESQKEHSLMSANDPKRTLLLNALTIFIGICSLVFTILLWGESIGMIVKLLFAPFLVDPGAGTNEDLNWCISNFNWCISTSMNSVYFGITLSTSLIIVAFVIALCMLKKKVVRVILSIFGILITSAHYAFVALVYLLSGFH